MTLRSRVTAAAGFAVLVAVLAVSIAVYVVVRGNLHDQVDESLRHSAPADQHDVVRDMPAVPPHLPLVKDRFTQVVDRNGLVVMLFDDRPLPVTTDVRAVARGERKSIFFDVDMGGVSSSPTISRYRRATTSADWRPASTRCSTH